MFDIDDIPSGLWQKENAPLLTGILRGAERECLRVTKQATISQRPHPLQLGASLTHPQITTDFSEALLEFITPPSNSVNDLISYLSLIQRFVIQNLENEEALWATSMPCYIESDANIPVARYGTSNNGKMKTVYRIGLGHRYGRSMQTVAGVHYNFSLPRDFWAFISAQENSFLDLQQFINEKYFSLIRNFRRHHWLLIYLFGGSPGLDKSFVRGRQHNLQSFQHSENCLHLPFATSLRMGDLGYQSSAQESLFICYNRNDTYIKTLCNAIKQQHPAYEKIGVLDAEQKYKQLNTHLLQIENEFYSAIRPKRTARPGETALSALNNRGVEYVEVRCLDVDPFNPLGISAEQIHFLDTFLVYCALKDSPITDTEEFSATLNNQKSVVKEGRKAGLMLDHQLGAMSVTDWGSQLLKAMAPVAELLDNAHQTHLHQEALKAQKAKIEDSSLTPSAQVLSKLKASNQSLNQFSLGLSYEHAQKLMGKALSDKELQRMQRMAEESHAEQKALEEPPQLPFSEFLANYYRQYGRCEELASDCGKL